MPIVITKEKLREWGACLDAYRWAAPRLNGGATLDQAVLAMERADWLLWLLWCCRAVTYPQLVKLACMCARKTLYIYEKRYPNDMRPRRAIEAAEAWSDDPTDENKVLAADAARAAYTTAGATAYVAAADAANATYATARATADAANAAYAADAAARATADVVCAPVYAATDAVNAAYAAAYAADAAVYVAYAAQKNLHTEMCAGIVEKLQEWSIIK